MAAEVTLKEESALEIGKSLANSFQGLQAVGADTANNGLEYVVSGEILDDE